MASPPAKSAKHHYNPRFVNQILIFHSLTSHIRRDEVKVVPILVHAFRHPIAEAIMVPRLVFTDIFPSVSPVVNRVPNVGCDQIHVDEIVSLILFKFDEVLGRFIPLGVDLFEKLECTVITLFVSFGFVFPFVVFRFEGLICLLSIVPIVGQRSKSDV